MIKHCRRCGEEFDGYNSAKYCPDCRHEVKLQHVRDSHKKNHVPTVKTCPVCKKEFSGYGKYCPDCRDDVRREKARECTRRYRQNHPGKKPVAKVHSLTKAAVSQLMSLIREAYRAGGLILDFGGQSALTEEQLAVVEQKYPDHIQNLGDLRNQKFLDAVDNFIEAYQPFKRKEKER